MQCYVAVVTVEDGCVKTVVCLCVSVLSLCAGSGGEGRPEMAGVVFLMLL